MRKSDIFLITIFLLIGIISFYFSASGKSGGSIEVYVDGELYGSYILTEDKVIIIDNGDGGSNTIEIANGEAFMKEANCPNKVCISQGKVYKDGATICCAPNRIMVIVKSGNRSEYDAITR